MNDPDSFLTRETSQPGGNHHLEQENKRFRTFISTLRNLIEAVDRHGDGADVMKLLDGILESALYLYSILLACQSGGREDRQLRLSDDRSDRPWLVAK
uniref:Uncharacterized protein n=1 Tax=Candidatus Kentrum sp. SD TaxID=2126332 RepID=A0A450YUD7_9GAMM|nr:MAG: hypothetical protein BECKSD772F_GA0070984_12133 [Candidatus Kentron sp. SD]VFK48611.1 MAG: hypothetical protein BECKSD772E_GA0070983_11327 [Candidatus Kentron sp. SD]VFK80533.1 MAG: hypothetical protein BECKSD772D_GA0070982_11246 [Candidatus Kentron sp. SD]